MGQATQHGGGSGHPALLSVEIHGGGWLDGVRVDLSPAYCCLIGSNGAGKTTLGEVIQYALGNDEVAGAVAEGRTKPPLQKRLGNGVIKVRIRTRDGETYTVQRRWGEKPQILDDKEALALDLVRDLGFRPDAFGHHEIQAIAVNRERQLAILDAIEERDTRAIESEMESLRRELQENSEKLRPLDRELKELREKAAGLEDVEKTLKDLGHVEGPAQDALAAAHAGRTRREKEKRLVDGLPETLRKLRLDHDAVAAAMSRSLDGWFDESVLEAENGESLRPIAERLNELARKVEESVATLARSFQDIEELSASQGKVLAKRHAGQEAAYQEILGKSADETGRARERAQKLREKEAIVDAARKLAARESDREKRDAERRRLLARLWEIGERRFEIRKRTAKKLTERLDGRVRISVLPESDRREYRGSLDGILKRKGIRGINDVLENLVERVIPKELLGYVARMDAPGLASAADIEVSQAESVVDVLYGTDALYELASIRFGDEPKIELREGDKEDAYKDSAELSMGERCAAFLPILLVASDQPLLIDEPEGSLNQYYLSETVAKSLRETRGERQYLFASHSAIVPVVGMAEQVILLEGNRERCRVAKSGTVEELREEIERSCDGGAAAFEQRRKLYGRG